MFELWCWRRLLRVLWMTKRSNQSIVKEISPEYSLEGLMLKLQYFGYLMRRTNSLGKTLMLRKIEGEEETKEDEMVGWQEEKGTTEDEMVGWHHQFNGHEFNVLQELVMDQEVHGLAKSPQGRKELDRTEQLN